MALVTYQKKCLGNAQAKKKKIIIYSKQLKDLKINYGKVRP